MKERSLAVRVMENEEDLFVFQGERGVSVAPSPAVPRHGKLTD